MTIVVALSKSISQRYPNFEKIPSKQKAHLIRNILKSAVKRTIPSLKFLEPEHKIEYEIKKLEIKGRHKEKYKKTHHTEINENLVDALYQLKRYQTKVSTTDNAIHLQQVDFTTTTQPGQISSSSMLGKPKYDYSNFSENKSKPSIFKSAFDKKIFESETKIRNHITQSKIKLEESLEEISVNFHAGYQGKLSTSYFKKPTITASLFHLYELHLFLEFVENLEQEASKKREQHLKDALNSSYDLIRSYFTKLLLIQGIELKKNEYLENTLLLDQNFMSLNENHPLMKGFHMLITQSIDIKKLEKMIEEKLFDIFSTNEASDISIKGKISKSLKKSIDVGDDAEILLYISEQGKVKLSNVQRKFLTSPYSVINSILRLESDGLIKMEKEGEEVFIIHSHKIIE